MSESDNPTGPTATDQSPDTNTATATAEAPKKIQMPKRPSLAKRVEEKISEVISPLKLQRVTYIDEKGAEHDATVTESFPIGSVYGKEARECKADEVIHHLEYIEAGIKKVVRSVHHIDRREPMSDGTQVCVWK